MIIWNNLVLTNGDKKDKRKGRTSQTYTAYERAQSEIGAVSFSCGGMGGTV